MKKSIGSLVFAATGLVAFSAVASAEMVTGSVQKIDPATNTLFIRRVDMDKNRDLPQELRLKVARDSRFKNITSLQDLKDGNEVKVDVKQNKDLGIWEAKSVELYNQAHV